MALAIDCMRRRAREPEHRTRKDLSDLLKPNKAQIALLVAAIGYCASAFAYVDPGSGMLVWQGLIAAIGAMVVFVRNPVATIKSLLSRFRKK